ncbi:protein Mp3R-MYB6 [Marchantia polymorpha subsp. ruderalis]|uniref:Uncharacterized protein n=2 Tax=Marchantia polymorpha TaxID=3197 RepID=A0AAF6BL27_MARPO|nr:hypothetical protein MARPO_0166s0022 [Marchantia polymorpha]BBN12711.1 hypothetical protein Mp_5g22280 [Marchantia polymorpha subsp. ruderalis]|eukprot:PTQ28367.1 hypothetical protein MARPO_0166s0022 [Marchantia polymorpha]
MEGSSSPAVSKLPTRRRPEDTGNSSVAYLASEPEINLPEDTDNSSVAYLASEPEINHKKAGHERINRKRHVLSHVTLHPPKKQFIRWTQEEDETLSAEVARHGGRNWRQIATALPNRSEVQCLHRWTKVIHPGLVKGYWTKEEDDRMIELVAILGNKRWAAVARSLPGRNGKQCRERWCNHLDPQLKKTPWTGAEDLMLFLAHQRVGNRWAQIAKLLPGRSDNGVKNRWNTAVRKKEQQLEEFCAEWDRQNESGEHQLLTRGTVIGDLEASASFFPPEAIFQVEDSKAAQDDESLIYLNLEDF